MKSIILTIVLLAIGCEAIKLQTSTKSGFSIPKVDVAALTDKDALKAFALAKASEATGVDLTTLTDEDALKVLARAEAAKAAGVDVTYLTDEDAL